MKEVWKPVLGHGAEIKRNYEVSNLGRVRSKARIQIRKKTTRDGRDYEVRTPIKERILKAQKLNGGRYTWVALCDSSGQHKTMVHRIVCRTFNGKAPKNKPLVLHGDDDPTNNTTKNLRWGNDQDNSNDRVARGRGARTPGEQHVNAILTDASARRMKAMRRDGWKLKDLAEKFGLGVSTVGGITTGRTWKHIP